MRHLILIIVVWAATWTTVTAADQPALRPRRHVEFDLRNPLPQRYLLPDGSVDFGALLSATNMQLHVRVSEVAGVNAGAGLLRLLGLHPHQTRIAIRVASDPPVLQQLIKQHDVLGQFSVVEETPRHSFLDIADTLIVEFDDAKPMDLRDGTLSVRYDPIKYLSGLPGHREELRRIMKVTDRPLILASVEREELEATVTAYQHAFGQLEHAQRPLLILGVFMREAGKSWLFEDMHTWRERGLRVAERDEDVAKEEAERGLPWLASTAFDALDLLVLTTQGELPRLWAAADVAIQRQDGNLFEPARSALDPTHPGLAILGFPGPWRNNLTPMQLFDRAMGEAWHIQPDRFAEQLAESANPHSPVRASLVSGVHWAISRFEENVAPKIKVTFSRLLAIAILSHTPEGALHPSAQLFAPSDSLSISL